MYNKIIAYNELPKLQPKFNFDTNKSTPPQSNGVLGYVILFLIAPRGGEYIPKRFKF